MSRKRTDVSDLFPEDKKVPVEQDFAAMFENSISGEQKRLSVGDKFDAEILSIGKEESFVSSGTPIDAVIMSADLLDSDKQMKYKVGDSIGVVVLRATNDEIRVTLQGSKSAPVDFDSLEDAFDMELPVEGKVVEVVKGGFRISIQKVLAFCPISQISDSQVSDAESFVGKRLEFIISRFEPESKNVVLSRRKLLDLQKAEKEGQWIQDNKVGDILMGRVTRLESYGAFVEVDGGVQGLVHISEIGFSRLSHASESLRLGDSVQVKILKVEEEEARLKVGLSIKQAGGVSDPWVQVIQDYPEGKIFEGIVQKKENYGLFVKITDGVNGLFPRSKWRDSEDATIYDGLKKGDSVKVKIDEIKFEERKISLGLPIELEDSSWKEHQASGASGMGALAAAFAKAGKKN